MGTTGISFGLHRVRALRANTTVKPHHEHDDQKDDGAADDDDDHNGDDDQDDEDEAYRRSCEKLHTVNPWKHQKTN